MKDMDKILRIKERFNITGRGIIYVVEMKNDTVIRIGDVFEDLRGNRFRLSGIEMFRRTLEKMDGDYQEIGVMFELIDKKEVQGNFLVMGRTKLNFLFCNHPLYSKKVDEDYQSEYQEAGAEYACALFSYEDLERGKLSLYGEEISGLTIYRGWMMKPEMYRLFYKLLRERDIILINSPEEYEKYHLLPGWYSDFADVTPFSVWENEGLIENILPYFEKLEGPYIVKDYVKSRKHEWYDACFIEDISNVVNTSKIITNFLNRQGETLTGGIVLRKFENLERNGYHEKSGMPLSEEYRVFIYAGQIMMIDDYWHKDGNVKLSDTEKLWLESMASKVKSNFISMDVARKDSGELIIMELGDGQVSGLQQIEPQHFYCGFSQNISIPIEELIHEDTVILAGDPMANESANDVRSSIQNALSVQELVDYYIMVHNKFWFIEDNLYDFEKGTPEYEEIYKVVCEWEELMNELDNKIMNQAEAEGLLDERKPNSGTVKQLERFMDKYGYRNGSGWWVKK